MTRPPEPDLSGAEALLAVYDGRAALLRRALARVREGHAPDVVTAVCEEALGGPDLRVENPLRAEARRIADRVHEAIGSPHHALRYLMEGRTMAFGGRTPCEVLQHGEAELLLYSLNVMQHGLCA